MTKHGIQRGVTHAKPFLKWVGGKQRLLSQYRALFPESFHNYFEPFVGSAALFFDFWNRIQLQGEVTLQDRNAELVNVYVVVRDQLPELLVLLLHHKQHHNKDYFYEIRELDRQPSVSLSPVEQAARTIYLNKTCYNGLYRVNSKGQFNSPMGRYKNPNICDERTLITANLALQGVNIRHADFRSVAESASENDFVYFDPPYDPTSSTANFTSYTAGNFTEQDQLDLAALFRQLTEQGCHCMLSNSHTEFVLELYQDYRIETVQAARAINSDPEKRGQITEVVVLNY